MAYPLHSVLTATVSFFGHPAALLVLLAGAAAWRWIEPDTFDMHGIATLIAIAMTLLIQRGQNRDTAALQAKLDELIHATDGARDEVAGLDEATADDIEEIRKVGKTP